MNKFYNCYSPKMMAFLAESKVLPLNMFFHKDTGKRVWVYEMNDMFSQLLFDWTHKKNVK